MIRRQMTGETSAFVTHELHVDGYHHQKRDSANDVDDGNVPLNSYLLDSS